MDRRILLAGFLAMGLTQTQAAWAESDLKKAIKNLGKSKLNASLSSDSADKGLREALSLGTIAAVARVGKPDGYWADNLIKIPLPNSLAKVQKTLKPLKMSGALDEVQLKMNRSAEIAAPVAKDLFVGAIKDMTISDALGIVRGGPTSGTQYLQQSTTPKLITLFTPSIQTALADTGAVQSLDRAIVRNGLGSYIKKEPKVYLSEFAVGKALDGLFHYVGQEEQSIRSDPKKRTTDLLRTVFG
jgi:hypothetical protein